jgi:hypothetical protein
VRPMLVNNSDEPFLTDDTDVNYLYRFSLTKVGDDLPVGYRSDKTTLLSIREEKRGCCSESPSDPLHACASSKLHTMKLSDRFEDLAPGNYILDIRYRTRNIVEMNGVQTFLKLSSRVSFQIVP